MENTVTISMEEYDGLKKDINELYGKVEEAMGAFSIDCVTKTTSLKRNNTLINDYMVSGNYPVMGSGGCITYGDLKDSFPKYESKINSAINFKPRSKNETIKHMVGTIERLTMELERARALHEFGVEQNKDLTDKVKELEGSIKKEIRASRESGEIVEKLKREIGKLNVKHWNALNSSKKWENRYFECYKLRWYETPERHEREKRLSSINNYDPIPKY